MKELKGLNGESLVLDGEWLSKLRASQETARSPVNRFTNAEVQELTRRTKLFGGEKEQVLNLTVHAGTFFGLTLPAAKRSEVDDFIAALKDAARPG